MRRRQSTEATISNRVDVLFDDAVHCRPLRRNNGRLSRKLTRGYALNSDLCGKYRELINCEATDAYSQDVIRSLEELELSRVGCQTRDEATVGLNFQNERPYTTLPRRSRALNIDGPFSSRDLRRLSRYPKSLQDLTYLEIEAILERDPRPVSFPMSDDHRFLLDDRHPRKLVDRQWRSENCERLHESLSRLDRHRPRESYVPGKVHYEREYRIYGKDTVALIYYKTCYL